MILQTLLACVLYWEAASEGPEAINGVASVIWHRARCQPKALYGVLTKPKQFSSVADRKLLAEKPVLPPADKTWTYCCEVARRMLAGQFEPVVQADHFHDTSMTPTWTQGMTYRGAIGRLRFWSAI
jgi:spore germination cell wall hydrolase CwlJ-like protein